MIVFFAIVTLALCLWALRDELRPGGSLFVGDGDDELGELLEFPLPDSWDADDVLRTMAEIEAL